MKPINRSVDANGSVDTLDKQNICELSHYKIVLPSSHIHYMIYVHHFIQYPVVIKQYFTFIPNLKT